MPKVLYKINRKQTGEPTAEEKWHDEIALKHYLKYCTSEKCIRGPEHQKKANWHENGFCLECTFNPYNMDVEVEHDG
jgi:hypothetical protein